VEECPFAGFGALLKILGRIFLIYKEIFEGYIVIYEEGFQIHI
jgi:hypothetical protein